MGDGSFFQWQVFLSAMLTWVICFFCTFQGVKISSYVVWVTVPLPVVLVFIMVMNGFTLKNSDYGFRMYLKGYSNDQPVDLDAKLKTEVMWAEACGQIFFTLSICWGVMVSYASYIDENAPIIKNGVSVALINCSFSFFAGFAVFAVVGYLVGLDSPVSNKTSSVGLAYMAFPAAIETMPAANFWALLFFLTLFTLGIDSAFAMVEGTVIVIQDSKWGQKLSKFVIAIIICLIGAAFTTLFCFNWGNALYDCVDHYLNIYTIMLMAILQCLGSAWYHCQDDAMSTCKISALVLIIGYFAVLAILPWLQYFAFPDDSWVGLVVWWVWDIVITLVSLLVGKFGPQKLSFVKWYDDIFFSGVRPICWHMMKRSESPWHPISGRIFEFYWCFSIKYIFPWAMYVLLVLSVKGDIEKPYGGYHTGWQVIGALIPIICFIVFLIPLIFNKEQPSGDFKKAFVITE